MTTSNIDPLNVREPWQIKLWFITRWWYRRYRWNLLQEYKGTVKDAMEFLNGECGQYTLSGAFGYKKTPEGNEFWLKKKHNFLAWYYHQPREYYRGKHITITNKGIEIHI